MEKEANNPLMGNQFSCQLSEILYQSNLHLTSININEAAQNHAEIVKAVALVVRSKTSFNRGDIVENKACCQIAVFLIYRWINSW